MSEIAKELGEVVPSNWCDPLLTGDSAALHGQPGTWSCHDIERLLNGIRERIQNHAALAAMVADAERYRFLAEMLLCSDYGDNAEGAIGWRLSADMRKRGDDPIFLGPDLNAAIDTARQAAGGAA